MKLIYIGSITTGLVIVAGISIVAPALLESPESEINNGILLFEIKESGNLPDWCEALANNLEREELPGTVFISGELASQYPGCVQSFGPNVDVGSQTYSYSTLPTMSDYLDQLDEVKEGKEAVDQAGGFDSKLFRAPNESTDENIYSLLSRSGIIADFSYDNQYNVYKDGQFIRYELVSVDEPGKIENLKSSVILITFDNTQSIQDILASIGEYEKQNVDFVKPSDLVGMQLTVREDA